MSVRRALLLSPLPLLVFGIYGSLRLARVQPAQESGMSEFITSGFLLFGMSVCYFAAVIFGLGRARREYGWWLAAAGLFLLLAVDESFMIHETLDRLPLVSETHVFLLYGLFLLVLLLALRPSRSAFWVLLSLFAVACGISHTADTFQGEGVLYVRGTEIDYEQILEMFGAMFLSAAFALHAALALESHFRRPSSPAHVADLDRAVLAAGADPLEKIWVRVEAEAADCMGAAAAGDHPATAVEVSDLDRPVQIAQAAVQE